MYNKIKIIFAKIIIFSFDKLFIILNKLKKNKYKGKEHYYKMIFFRTFFKNYYIVIEYCNPLTNKIKIKNKINLIDNCSQHYFTSKGKYEIEWISLIHKILPYYNCFIDIGANLGIYSTIISQANPLKNVIAIEALQKNYDLLNENIKINNISNCKCLKKAVSNNKGKLKFYINPIHDGGGSIIKKNDYRTGNIIIDAKKYQKKHKDFKHYREIESIMINDIIKTKSIIKIDVEGSELDVLKSGINTFNKGLCNVIVVEVLMKKTFYDVIKFMNELNYQCFTLKNNEPLTGIENMDWFVFNIICVKKECDEYKNILDIIQKN